MTTCTLQTKFKTKSEQIPKRCQDNELLLFVYVLLSFKTKVHASLSTNLYKLISLESDDTLKRREGDGKQRYFGYVKTELRRRETTYLWLG